MPFKEAPNGLFRYQNLVYTKINETQAVIITSGRIVDFQPEELIEEW